MSVESADGSEPDCLPEQQEKNDEFSSALGRHKHHHDQAGHDADANNDERS